MLILLLGKGREGSSEGETLQRPGGHCFGEFMECPQQRHSTALLQQHQEGIKLILIYQNTSIGLVPILNCEDKRLSNN